MPQVSVGVGPAGVQVGPPLGTVPLAQSNADKAVELLQAQIAGVKKEIGDLTAQLNPGTSRMREQAIDQQLSSAGERLQQLQQQLDRVVSGDAPFTLMPPELPNFNDERIPHQAVDIIEMVLITTCVIALGVPFMRMITRRFERRHVPEMSDASARFDRLEQAVDAVAIEVERISEGQRYSSKLLTDLRALPAPNPLEQWPVSRASVREELQG